MTVEAKLAAIAAAVLNCELGLQSIQETYYRIQKILSQPACDKPPQQEPLDPGPGHGYKGAGVTPAP